MNIQSRSTNQKPRLSEYHYPLQQVRKFFDFCGISIGQNVSNFSPMFFITFIWFCVFVFPSPTLFREHLSEADNDFVTNNKKLCIQPSPK